MEMTDIHKRLIEIRDSHQKQFLSMTMKERKQNLHDTNQLIRQLIIDTGVQ